MQDILFAALVLKMSKSDDMGGGQAEIGNCTKRIPFRGNHRSRITLLAWLLVLPASVVFAAGGLTARLGRYEWERASPTGDAQPAASAGNSGVGPSSADVLVDDP